MSASRVATRVFLAAVASVALAAGVLVSTASAGGNVFGVTVSVVGPVPSGTTFTVDISCSGVFSASGQFTFDSTGAPTGTPFFSILGVPTVCSATQSQTGGAATVTSTCTGAINVSCLDDHTASFATFGNGNGIIHFTDGFVPPVSVVPASGAPGQQFTVSGTGCTKALFGGSAGNGGPVTVTAGFAPPIVMNTTAAGTTGAWSVTFTVPAAAANGPVSISAVCDDPAPYPAASFTVVGAATAIVPIPGGATAIVATPGLTG